MSESLHRALDALIAQKAETIDIDQIHLSPYYGDAYAEIVNLAAGPDFNFIFHWGPRLEAHERIVIEVLVYVAREAARQTAMQSMRMGEREIPVQIYLERVPETVPGADSADCLRHSLTQLTNLDRKKVYAALKSPNVASFITREPTARIHRNGRVITPPARFRVRVDPVPTPEQVLAIRSRIAEQLVAPQLSLSPQAINPPMTEETHHPQLTLTSPCEPPVKSHIEPSLTSLYETSVTAPSGTSAMNKPGYQIDTSGIPPYVRKMMSLNETSNPTPPDVPNRNVETSTPGYPPQIRLVTETEENPRDRIVSESRIRGPETPPVMHESIEAWRQKTEDLARNSSRTLFDKDAFAWHICIWAHARNLDRKNKRNAKTDNEPLTNALFDILRSLEERCDNGRNPQGPAWTRRALRLFEDNGVPLAVKRSSEAADNDDVAAVRAALASAPFMQHAQTPPPHNGQAGTDP